MKTLSRAVIISFFLASGAAQAATMENTTSPAESRADVVSQLHDWQARGQSFLAFRSGYPVAVPNSNPESRQQVVEELNAARAAGQVTFQDELNYPPATLDSGNAQSRDQVKADLQAYRAEHGPETFEE